MFLLKLFKSVFKKPGYVILTIVITGLILLISVWLGNRQLLSYVFTSGLFGWEAKLKIIWLSLRVLGTGFTVAGRLVIISLALLVGINVSCVVFYLKRQTKVLKAAGAGGLGLAIGLLGAGCGSCGSIILASIFGLTAALGFISFLPFKGLEFGLLGIVLILISIYLLAKKINQPKAC